MTGQEITWDEVDAGGLLGFDLGALGPPKLICYSDATENVVWPLART